MVGTTDKKTAHATGQLHRVGAIYVFDGVGKLYVQVYKPSNGSYDHSFGGYVAKGETYAEGTMRQAEEALGITHPLKEVSFSMLMKEVRCSICLGFSLVLQSLFGTFFQMMKLRQ